jgi:hypothetical protein
MHRLRIVLVPMLALVLAVVAGSAALAASSTSSNAKFTVATTVAISGGAILDFGTIVPGAATSSQSNALTIQSNDANGFQVAAVQGGTGTYVEQPDQLGQGTCTPNAANTVPGSAVNLTPAAVTGGTGTAGTPTAAFNLGASAVNLWSTAPLATGAAMSEALGVIVNAPAATHPNSIHCAYFIPFTLTITAL